MKGLEERSRAPKKVSNRTSEEVERLIVSEKRQHMTWGPKKIQRVLMIKHGLEKLPAVSTVGEVLKRHGMVEVRKRRGAVFKVERSTDGSMNWGQKPRAYRLQALWHSTEETAM